MGKVMTNAQQPFAGRLAPRLVSMSLVVVLALPLPAVAGDHDHDPPWAALQAQSLELLSMLVRDREHRVADDDQQQMAAAGPRMIVVGFTGGLERKNSRVSGVVRLRKKIEDRVGDTPGVAALAYSNFAWRRASEDVRALAAGTSPVIVVYGHSWGAGAISKFARSIDRGGLEVALAVYIDAFTLRNPRVPANVRYAVNIYQRTGLLRGLPLRGKSKLLPVDPERTHVLANLRVTPETEHFGWNWNLVQPLFYRHHHRIGHDVRIQGLLLDLVSVAAGAVDAASEP